MNKKDDPFDPFASKNSEEENSQEESFSENSSENSPENFVIAESSAGLLENEEPPEESPLSFEINSEPSTLDTSPETSPQTAHDTHPDTAHWSEKVSSAAEQIVPATYPFSLLITGPLTAHEKEKLLDILSRENMGIREVDLEPQFISERVLIPRMSEYAGVLLVQALRGTRAKLRLGPADSIFMTEETREEYVPETEIKTGSVRDLSGVSSDGSHPAERIRISADSSIPGIPQIQLIDFVIASATLEAETVEAQSSPEYQAILDALIRELKYKAYRKGALAITQFALELVSLSLPSQYRLTVSGSAVKAAEPEISHNSPDFN